MFPFLNFDTKVCPYNICVIAYRHYFTVTIKKVSNILIQKVSKVLFSVLSMPYLILFVMKQPRELRVLDAI